MTVSESVSAGLTFTVARFCPPAIAQAASAAEEEEEQKAAGCSYIRPTSSGLILALSSCELRLTDAPQTKACIAICRQLRRTAAGPAELELMLQLSGGLLAGL